MDEVLYWVCTKRAPCLMAYDKQTQRDAALACAASKSDSAINCDNVPVTPKKKNKRKLTILDDESATTEKPNNLYFEVPKNTEEHPVLNNTVTNVHTLCVNKCKPCPSSKRQKLQNGREKRPRKNLAASPKQVKPPQIRRSPRVANKSKLYEFSNNVDESKSSPTKQLESNLALRPRKLNIVRGEDGDQTNALQKPTKIDFQPTAGDDDSDVSGFTANYIRSTKVKKCDKNKIITASWKKVEKTEEQVIISYNKSMNTPNNNKHANEEPSLSSFNVLNVVTVPRASKSAMLMRPPCLKSNKVNDYVDNDKSSPEQRKRVTHQIPDKPTRNPISSKQPTKNTNNYGGSSSSINFVNVPEEWNANTEIGVRTRSRGGLALKKHRKITIDSSSDTSDESIGVVFNVTTRRSKNTQTCHEKKGHKRKPKPKMNAAGACLKPGNQEFFCTCVTNKSPRGRKKSSKDKLQVPSCSNCLKKHVTNKTPYIIGDEDKKSGMEKGSSIAFCIHIDNKTPGRKCCLPSGTYVNRDSPEGRNHDQTNIIDKSEQEQLVYLTSNTQNDISVKDCKLCLEKMCRDNIETPILCSCIQENNANKTGVSTRSSPKKRLSSKRESLRNKSGFTACYSDSGCSDCEGQHSKKFFC